MDLDKAHPLDHKPHEIFCRCVGHGGSVFECYRRAGYADDRIAAQAFAKSPRIARRIREVDFARIVEQQA